jgi:hypothetical protein
MAKKLDDFGPKLLEKRSRTQMRTAAIVIGNVSRLRDDGSMRRCIMILCYAMLLMGKMRKRRETLLLFFPTKIPHV